MFGLFVFNTTILPTEYDIMFEYDFLTNPNIDPFSITDILTTYTTPPLSSSELSSSNLAHNCDSCSSRGCDIIIESGQNLELEYRGETFYCKRGTHYLSQWLSGTFGGDLQICKNQKYKIYVVSNVDKHTGEKNKLLQIMVKYREIIFLEDFYHTDENAMIGHYAAYFGVVPNARDRAAVDICSQFAFNDNITYNVFLQYLERGHFSIIPGNIKPEALESSMDSLLTRLNGNS